jgi:hypothetical protein
MNNLDGIFNMSMKTLSINEIRSLLTAVSEHGNQHLVEVESDLMQTTYLLNEAIEKLGVSFMGIHMAVTEQQVLIDALTKKNECSAEEIKKLAAYKQEIASQINLAITGLQFQDLTSQLISTTIKHVVGVKDLLKTLSLHDEGTHNDMDADGHDEIKKLLSDISYRLNISSHMLSVNLHKSVNQRDMGSGEIELF